MRKIYELTAGQASADLSAKIIAAIQDVKGQKITLIDLSDIESAPSSEFIICEGKSNTQVSAIADNIEEQIRKDMSRKPYNIDGQRNSQWIVIDYGTVLVHVFQPEMRNLYNLEELWGDAKITEIPDID